MGDINAFRGREPAAGEAGLCGSLVQTPPMRATCGVAAWACCLSPPSCRGVCREVAVGSRSSAKVTSDPGRRTRTAGGASLQCLTCSAQSDLPSALHHECALGLWLSQTGQVGALQPTDPGQIWSCLVDPGPTYHFLSSPPLISLKLVPDFHEAGPWFPSSQDARSLLPQTVILIPVPALVPAPAAHPQASSQAAEMPVAVQDVMRLLGSVSKKRGLVVVLKGDWRGVVKPGVGAWIGTLLGGVPGMAVGGIIGTLVGGLDGHGQEAACVSGPEGAVWR
ncbi:uncharacterized protein LOC123806143 [Phyllostomus hastatus]|uniref:uncharacterized protein LOC123806143 n=1 Tax=Phyllostomus hastatus TaxID=9423 RepID=UPI001E67E20B|nr:uncharacterized protein LOC123806143 [Phyllostomus hastatus]